MLRIIFHALYDSLATFDIAAGVLLASIWFQTGYVALFRAMHGDEAGRVLAPAAATAKRPAADRPGAPWGAG